VLLPHELVKRARAHPGSERLPLGRRLEKGLRLGSADASGWHDWIVPPLLM
jgi:hypothetical protein